VRKLETARARRREREVERGGKKVQTVPDPLWLATKLRGVNFADQRLGSNAEPPGFFQSRVLFFRRRCGGEFGVSKFGDFGVREKSRALTAERLDGESI
jgi:hypothetical protein